MAGHLMVLNPTKKRRRHKHKKRKLSAKQIAAGFGGKRGRKKKSRAKVIVVESNPTRGRKMAKKRRRHRRHRLKFLSNPKRRRFRRNPTEGGFMAGTIRPAAVGAAGAILSNYLQTLVPLFSGYQAGIMGPIIQIGYAMVVGKGVEAFAGQQAGEEAAAGGVVLALYSLFTGLLGGTSLVGGQQGMSRYLGYLRRNPQLLQAVNQRRALRGLQPINMRPRMGLAGNPMAVGVLPMQRQFGLGATSPNTQTRMRINRSGLGWISPARNLSRYVR